MYIKLFSDKIDLCRSKNKSISDDILIIIILHILSEPLIVSYNISEQTFSKNWPKEHCILQVEKNTHSRESLFLFNNFLISDLKF